MALRNAILATLLEGEASGYDLAKGFDGSVANFWAATPQQLYRELERMAADGLVAARLVEQTGRPNKRMFSLTDAGRDELGAYTTHPPRPIVIRDELLVAVQSMESGDVASVQRWVAARQESARSRLTRYLRLRDRLLDGRSEAEFVAGAERIGPYLTLARGISFEEENIRWCSFVLGAIASRLDRAVT
jgi:DNA-binding PadR family transcriptional regulator